MKRIFALSLLVVVHGAVAVGALAGEFPVTTPEQVGLSTERLARLEDAFRAEINKGALPGAVLAVARHGKLAYFKALGFRDKAAGAPMVDDAIFRVYSMTKPITSVAVMMLWEEGRFQLSDPVSKYLPDLAKPTVLIESTDPVTGQVIHATVPASREITIQDLLRHSSGITYGGFGKPTKVKDMYIEAGADFPSVDQTNAQLVARLGKLPLMFHPGTVWEYGRSTDVLGALVEAVSGQTLGAFLAERILAPLGMTDTGFYVPEDKLGRIAERVQEANLPADASIEKKPLLDVTKPPKLEAGGHGLVSTPADYLSFCQMLLNGGTLDGKRILGRKTVDYMTSDHLQGISRQGPAYLPGPGYGFGLGFGVRETGGNATLPGSVGDFYWGGFAGTYFWVDPKEDLVAVYMTQEPQNRSYYRALFKSLVLAAIEE